MARETETIIVAFDDWVHGMSDVYTSTLLEERLADLDGMAIEAVVEGAGGVESITVQIEHTGDGRWWASKNPVAEINAESTPSGARTVVWGFDMGVRPSLDRVRLRIRLGVIGGSKARVVIYVRGAPLTRFVPGSVAGCAAWFRSDRGVTLSSGAVSNWQDLTGNGRDATQSTSSQRPALSSSDYFNGLPVLTFDGSNDLLATSAFALGVYSVFMVTSTQSVVGYFWTRSSAGVEADTLYGSTGHTTYVKRGAAVSGYNHTSNWAQGWGNTPRVLIQRYDGTHAGHTVRMNQTAIATTNSSAGEPGTGTTSDAFVIAGRNDGYAAAGITIAEVAVFNRALVAPELLLLEEYARRRYRLGF